MNSTNNSKQPEPLREAILLLASKVNSPTLRARLIAAANQEHRSTSAAAPVGGEPISADVRRAILALPADNLTRQRGMAEGWLTDTAPPAPQPERVTACQPLRTLTAPQAAILAALTTQPLTLAEICRQRPMPESTARRALAGLVAGGYATASGYGTNAAPFTWTRST
jgi:hypothetical protein